MTALTCPNCGDAAPELIATAAIATCRSCDTTLMLTSGRVTSAGTSGVMHDVPLLFGLGDQIKLGKKHLQIEGHLRYSYGRGFWDEFAARDSKGARFWVSVDEGDIILQRAIAPEKFPKLGPNARVGQTAKYGDGALRVTEVSQAECIAFRGVFPDPIRVGDRHRFINAQSDSGLTYSGEFWEDGRAWYVGAWHDPFDVVIEVTS